MEVATTTEVVTSVAGVATTVEEVATITEVATIRAKVAAITMSVKAVITTTTIDHVATKVIDKTETIIKEIIGDMNTATAEVAMTTDKRITVITDHRMITDHMTIATSMASDTIQREMRAIFPLQATFSSPPFRLIKMRTSRLLRALERTFCRLQYIMYLNFCMCTLCMTGVCASCF